jgi:hypothetical protein
VLARFLAVKAKIQSARGSGNDTQLFVELEANNEFGKNIYHPSRQKLGKGTQLQGALIRHYEIYFVSLINLL